MDVTTFFVDLAYLFSLIFYEVAFYLSVGIVTVSFLYAIVFALTAILRRDG